MAIIIRKSKDGYVLRTGYDETRWGKSNEAAQHRFVVEEYIGGSLPALSVVHHIDRHRDHNKIENLLLLPSQQIHMLLHSYMTQGKTILADALTRWCLHWMQDLREKNLGISSESPESEIEVNHDTSAITIEGQNINLPVSRLLDQYLELKLAFPEHVALIQVGCFYTAYEDDAKLLGELLGYRLYPDRFTKLTAAGTSVNNEKFLDQLESKGVSFVVVGQSDLPRRGRVLDRHVQIIHTAN